MNVLPGAACIGCLLRHKGNREGFAMSMNTQRMFTGMAVVSILSAVVLGAGMLCALDGEVGPVAFLVFLPILIAALIGEDIIFGVTMWAIGKSQLCQAENFFVYFHYQSNETRKITVLRALYLLLTVLWILLGIVGAIKTEWMISLFAALRMLHLAFWFFISTTAMDTRGPAL